MQTATLNGSWEFRCLEEERWLDAIVPGGVYGDLLSADATDHPYDRDNELDVQWVATSDWEYRRTITLDEEFLDHERVILQCDGLDTVATVAVNDETVGTSENMHRQYEFDVADVLTAGENEIRVTFRSPVEYASEQADNHPYEVPTLRYPVDQPCRNFIRKAQCHFGWDWGPCLPTVGIWRDIRLVAHTTPRISYVTPVQYHTDSDDVELDVRVGLDIPVAGKYIVTASVVETSATVSRQCRLESSSEVELSMTVEDPDLWWPAGHGDQPLYELDVSVEKKNARSEKRAREDAHRVTNRLGFREVELIRELDGTEESEEDGESFHLQVNGEPIFARGANWIPVDAINQNVTSEKYDDLLSSAVDANMNTIRVWGGGYYERDEFYRLCDEKGLLVWQDFMFACALYPADDAFVESVEAEARYQVRRLSTHPSVGMWCGNNELEVGLESWFADSTHITDLESDYWKIFEETLSGVIEEEDPSCPYWSASPSSGGDLLDPEAEDRGDIHYWGVWHDGKPFSAFLDTAPRFVSEFGYQSFPSEETLADVIPANQRNPTAPLMEHHQRNEGGNKRILQRMGDHFRMPSRFEDFVYLSQLQQGIAIRTAVEHWRRSKPRCMGSIYWQLNDLWQCASWSSVEYGGGWKALHYMARRFYEPVHTSMVESDERDELAVWVTSDEREPVSGPVTVTAVTMDGQRVFEERFDALLDKNESAHIGTIDIENALDGTPRSDVLFSARSDGLGSSPAYHVLVPYKQLSISDTDLSVSVADGSVTVRASEAALFVELDSNTDGRFSDNYFHLAPNESCTIDYACDDTLSDTELSETLSVTHLAETY
jgi:beta-mannosidase